MKCNCCGSADWLPLFDDNGLTLGRCTSCDLHYVSPMPRREQRMTEMESGHFAGTEEVSSAGGQTVAENALIAQFEHYADLASLCLVRQRSTATVLDRAKMVGSERSQWLDIGCGTGLLLKSAFSAGYDVQGIELTADRRVAATQTTNARIYGQPLEDLGLPDQSVDVISMINVFSHLTDPSATFVEILRVLRADGIVLIATGEVGASVRKAHVFKWNLGDHLYFLGGRTMGCYADSFGLSMLECERKWLPEQALSDEFLRTPGRSKARNIAKRFVVLLPPIKRLLLWQQRGNPVYSSVFVLSKLPLMLPPSVIPRIDSSLVDG